MNLLGKMVKKIEATQNASIIAVIGSGMKGTVGVAAKVFSAAQKKKRQRNDDSAGILRT